MSHKYELDKDLIAAIFSHMQLGIVILEKNNIIRAINSKAADFLGLPVESSISRNLKTLCPELFIEDKIFSGTVTLINGKKVTIELIESMGSSEDQMKILSFQDAYVKQTYSIMENIINSIDEAIMACDRNGKMIIYNDANQKLDNLLKEQVLDQPVTKIYNLTQETSLLLQAMKEGKPILNKHQNYTTYTGKNINIVCSTYPLFKNNEVIGAVSIMRDSSKIEELTGKVIELQEQLYKRNNDAKSDSPMESSKYTFHDIIGLSQSIQQIISMSKKAAASDSSVLIYGETGTGKELFAQSIHNASKRSSGPFIAINCAAIPENLLEGILFGTVKGSFTGSVDRPGLFEQADHGTLLLDELNSMSIGLQSKLLRVLQEGRIRRVGALNEIPINVRIISIINLEPSLAIKSQKLRQDLFYRLSVIYLKIPLLCNHKEDIPLLSKTFIDGYNKKLSKNVRNLSPQVMGMFMEYSWPGNIRELQHSIESAMNIIDDDENVIQPKHLPQHILPRTNNLSDEKINLNLNIQAEPLSDTMQTVEKHVISLALQRNDWNVSYTSRQLGIKRQSLQYRMKKYGIKKNS